MKLLPAIMKGGAFAFTLFTMHTSAYAQTYVPAPYYTGFESGSLGPEWTATSSQSGVNIEVIQSGTLVWSTETALSYAGNYFLGMDYGTGGAYNLNQADLHLNLNGSSNLRFEFQWAEWNDETEAQDGIYVSDDGGTSFVKVLDLNGASYTDLAYTHFDMSLDSINAVHGLSFTSQYIIRLQQYDNYYFAGGNDGFLFDEISIYNTCGSSSSIAVSNCFSYTVPSGDETYTTSGVYFDTIPNTALCDSIITINLTINSTSSSIITSACNSYTAPDGAVYNSSGIYQAVILNSVGCDSTITINLTVGQPESSTIAPVVCDTYTAPDGAVYNSSGSYQAIIPTVAGCDSTITINLTVNQSASSTISPTVCESYSSPGSNTYTTSGVYMETIPTTSGCDSTITINLTVNNSSSATINESALDFYTVPSGDETYTSSGVYMDTISNAAGCDSVLTINLTVAYTGLEDLEQGAIGGYPNPVSDSYHLIGLEKLAGIRSMYVVNLGGQRVLTVSPSATQVNVSHLTPGLYYLIIDHGGGTLRIHLIKE